MFLIKSIFFLIPTIISSEKLFLNPILLENLNQKNRIFGHETNKIQPIASLTKLYTIFFVKKNYNLEKRILISENSPANSINPKATKFQKGEIYTTEEILKSMLITSSNQAAIHFAETYFSTLKKFRLKANQFLVKQFPNTILDDPSGLSEKSVSNIDDISTLLDEIYLDKTYFSILELKETEIKSEKGRIQILKSTLELDQINGFEILGKTGSTKKAGKCFAGFLRKKNEIYKIIILNSENIYLDMEKLIKLIQK